MGELEEVDGYNAGDGRKEGRKREERGTERKRK